MTDSDNVLTSILSPRVVVNYRRTLSLMEQCQSQILRGACCIGSASQWSYGQLGVKDIGYCFAICGAPSLFVEAPPLCWALSTATAHSWTKIAIKPPMCNIPCFQHPLTSPVSFLCFQLSSTSHHDCLVPPTTSPGHRCRRRTLT